MIPDSAMPPVTGEAAPLPLADESAMPVADELPAPTPARAAVFVVCRRCGFGWSTTVPLPAPCVSCHRGYREPAGLPPEPAAPGQASTAQVKA